MALENKEVDLQVHRETGFVSMITVYAMVVATVGLFLLFYVFSMSYRLLNVLTVACAACTIHFLGNPPLAL